MTRGGVRKGAGRPRAKPGEARVKVSVAVDPELDKVALYLGEGNRSAGVNAALRHALVVKMPADEREKFEAWASTTGIRLDRDATYPDQYCWSSAHWAWGMWQTLLERLKKEQG